MRNPGFLWFTFVDVHLLTFAGARAFPDEDVPLSTLEFLAVTIAAFLPWSLATPLGRKAAWDSAGEARAHGQSEGSDPGREVESSS